MIGAVAFYGYVNLDKKVKIEKLKKKKNIHG